MPTPSAAFPQLIDASVDVCATCTSASRLAHTFTAHLNLSKVVQNENADA